MKPEYLPIRFKRIGETAYTSAKEINTREQYRKNIAERHQSTPLASLSVK
jgi:hypothetical protein